MKFVERFAWGAGLALLLLTAAGYAHRALLSRSDIAAFEAARATVPARESPGVGGNRAAVLVSNREPAKPHPAPDAAGSGSLPEIGVEGPPDFSLWSPTRIEDYREAQRLDQRAPIAVLRIPSLDIEVAVLPGTDELTLNRGVGHIDGTAMPGQAGNVGLAGHRDGFFRPLKSVEPGARVELATLDATLEYRVTDTWIVDPSDVHVLDQTTEPSITLVTCYPFYFVGHAPQRYVVRAVLDSPHGAGTATKGQRAIAAETHGEAARL